MGRCREHDYNFLEAMMEKHKPGMEHMIHELEARCQPIQEAIDKLVELERELCANHELATTAIVQHHEAWVRAIERRKETLLAECRDLKASKSKGLEAQRHGLESTLASMNVRRGDLQQCALTKFTALD